MEMFEINRLKINMLRCIVAVALLVFHAPTHGADSDASRGSSYRIGSGDIIRLCVLVGGEEQINVDLVGV